MAQELARAPARALYHAVWQLVAANFYAVERLSAWAEWEHKFDEVIVDEASALASAAEMLASLGDPYTEIRGGVCGVEAEAGVGSAPAEAPPAVTAILTPTGLAYLRILNFDDESIAAEIFAAAARVADCQGVLLDLRGNAGGRMHRAIEAAGAFIENGVVTTIGLRQEGASISRKYCLTADQFYCSQNDAVEICACTYETYERRPAILAGKPMVILVNRRTASAAEMFAAALLQNAEVGMIATVGSDTAGKGIGQAIFALPDSDATLSITRSHWFAPGGEWVGDCGQTLRDPIQADIAVSGDTGPEALKVAADTLRSMIAAAADRPAA